MMMNAISTNVKIGQADKDNHYSPPAWRGMLALGDSALAVTDTGGPGVPVIYLNGQFATQKYWRKVITDLADEFRHITYDERGRGKKSKTSADYSFETCVNDVDAVLSARKIEQCVVAGWSYGAFVAAHWASRNPGRCIGAVLVDGAQPCDWMTSVGITPRISAAKMAEINIELGYIARVSKLGPVMDHISVPARYVLASGTSFGSKGDEQEQIRKAVNMVVECNPHIKISAKVLSNHDAILKKDFSVVANAVREVCGLSNEKSNIN